MNVDMVNDHKMEENMLEFFLALSQIAVISILY